MDEFLMDEDNSTIRKWALLAAGSYGWDKYRHQADICHAYQILHEHGIPDEHIVVMINPDKGIIINHPKGSDVYHDVPHDYVGKDITPENFLKILSGDMEAMRGIGSGKVIDSDSDDHIFVYFADHGAKGVISFPDDDLTANQLHESLKSMWNLQKYGQMVIYIEAADSGSMFDTFDSQLKEMKIFATTAVKRNESSFACSLDNRLDTFLGDCYSVNWDGKF